MSTKRFSVSQHALDRWREYTGLGVDELDSQLHLAVPYGAQRGTDTLYKLPSNYFAAVSRDLVVKTILRPDHAFANMQDAGIAVPNPVRSLRPGVDYSSLAAKHAIQGMSRKERIAELQKFGFDTNGPLQPRYAECYRAAKAVVSHFQALQNRRS